MGKPRHLQAVMEYAMETADSVHVEEMQRLSARRFLLDLKSGKWDFRPGLPEWLIDTVQGLFCFSQGERLDGTPLRGQPMELMPWHLFSYYNIGGFFYPGTQIRRFTEADWFAPRKTVKTTAGEGLQTALAMHYRLSGAKAKTVAGSLKQGLEGFDWLVYNFQRLGLIAPNNPPGKLKLLNSSLGHSIEGLYHTKNELARLHRPRDAGVQAGSLRLVQRELCAPGRAGALQECDPLREAPRLHEGIHQQAAALYLHRRR